MLEEEPRKFTAKEMEENYHRGYKIAEELYSKQIIELKETIKKLIKENHIK